MDPISDLRHIPCNIHHTQPDLMISETILATTWITGYSDIIGSIVPEESNLTSPWIIRAICIQIDRTSKSIAIELVSINLFVV